MLRRMLITVLLAVASLPAEQALAQQRQVTGTVTGAQNAPLAGAGVGIAGASRGVRTDARGAFTLSVPAGEVRLRVTAPGYRARELGVGAGQASVSVRLEEDILNLEGLVVTGQATAVSRANVANAVSVVTERELNRAPAQTVEKALQGKIAGANISTNSGAPGGGVQIQLRGVSSIGGNADPLFVVDGVIVSNERIASGQNAVSQASRGVNFSNSQDQLVNRIADLNPGDIESIEVLKGASASAIYGSKAANGVIIIKTRAGRAGAPRFTLSQRFGYSEPSRRLGSRDWTLPAALDQYATSSSDSAFIAGFFDAGTGLPKQTFDNEAAVFGRQAPARETNLSVSGGTESSRYYVSGTVLDQQGIAANTGYSKEAIHLKLDQSLGSRVQLGVGANVLHSVAARGLTGNDNSGTSYYAAISQTPSFFDLRAHGGVFPTNPFAASNPAATAALATNDEGTWRAIASANLSADLLRGERHTLRLLANGGADYFQQRNELYFPRDLQFEEDDGFPGTAVLGEGQNVNLNGNVNLVHIFTPFSGAFTATTSAGMQYEDRDKQTALVVGRNTTSRIAANAAKVETEGDRARARDFGFYVQEELLLMDERLSLTGSLRGDRSSVNSDDGQYYYFPKAAASYRLDNLASFLDELKLRGAFGSSGNLPNYGDKFTSLLSDENLEGTIGLRVNGPVGDPDLRPERTTELEAGFDAVLLGGNARLELTGWRKKVSDFIISPPLAPSTGFGQYTFNGGDFEVKGLEAMLEATPFRSDRVTWVSRTTFAMDRAKVLDLRLPGDDPAYNPGFHFGFDYGGYRVIEGESPTSLWGLDPDLGERIYGDANPSFRMGFSNDLTFGAFNLSGLVDWAHGGLVANLTRSYYDDASNSPDYTECNASDSCAAQARVDRYGDGYTVYLEDASYVKLREVSLSYQLPASLLGRVGSRVQSARISLEGRNLYTWTGYSGLDPEVSNFGNRAVGRSIDVTPFPPSRSFWLGFNVGF